MVCGTICSEDLAIFFENYFLELSLLLIKFVNLLIVINFWILSKNYLARIAVFSLTKLELLNVFLISFAIQMLCPDILTIQGSV